MAAVLVFCPYQRGDTLVRSEDSSQPDPYQNAKEGGRGVLVNMDIEAGLCHGNEGDMNEICYLGISGDAVCALSV
jgi:hypothetical protein